MREFGDVRGLGGRLAKNAESASISCLLRLENSSDGIIISRTNALPGLNMRDKATFYYVVLAIAVLFFFGLRRLTQSSFGTVISGIRQNERRMAAIGIAALLVGVRELILRDMPHVDSNAGGE